MIIMSWIQRTLPRRDARSVKCCSTMENKPVFQAHWMTKKNTITLEDARDAYELCKYVPSKNKEECYAVYGVDGKNVEQYLQTVEDLNRILSISGIHESKVWSIDVGNFCVIFKKK